MAPCDLGAIQANQATALIVNKAIKEGDVETLDFINGLSEMIQTGKNNFIAGSYQGVAQMTKGRVGLEAFALSKLTDSPTYKKVFFDSIKSQTEGIYYFSKRAVGLADFADKMAIDYTSLDAATMQQVFGDNWKDVSVDLQNVYRQKAIGDYMYAQSLDQTISRTMANRGGRKAFEESTQGKELVGQFNTLQEAFEANVAKRVEDKGISQADAINAELQSIYGDSIDSRLMVELINAGGTFKTYSDILTYQAINFGAMDLDLAVSLLDKFSFKFDNNITDSDKERFWVDVTNAPVGEKQQLIEEWYTKIMTDGGRLIREQADLADKTDIIRTSIFATNAYSTNPKVNPFDLAQVFVIADRYGMEESILHKEVSDYFMNGKTSDNISKIIADGGERDLYHVLGAKQDFIKGIYGDSQDVFKAFNLSEGKWNGFINDEYKAILEDVMKNPGSFYKDGLVDREAFKEAFLNAANSRKEIGDFTKNVSDYISQEFYSVQPNGQTLFENTVLKNSSNQSTESAGKRTFLEYELSPSTNDGQALRKMNELAFEANSLSMGGNVENIIQMDYNQDIKKELIKLGKAGPRDIILNKSVPGLNPYDKDIKNAGITLYMPQKGTRYVYRDGQLLMQTQRRETLNKLFGDLGNQDILKTLDEEQQKLFNEYISEFIEKEYGYQADGMISTMESLADISDYRKNYIAIRNRVKNIEDWTGYKPATKELIDKASADIDTYIDNVDDSVLGPSLASYLQETFGTTIDAVPVVGDRNKIRELMKQVAYGDQGAHVALAQEIGIIPKDKVPFDLTIPTEKISLYRDTVANVGWQVPSDNPYGKLFFDTLNNKQVDVRKAIELMGNKSTVQEGIKLFEQGLGDEQKRQLLGWVDELASTNGMYTDLIRERGVDNISKISSDDRIAYVMPDVISKYFDEMERAKQVGTNFNYVPEDGELFNQGFLNKTGVQPDTSNSVKLATTKNYDYVISTDFGSTSVKNGQKKIAEYTKRAETVIDEYYMIARQSINFGATEKDMRQLQREYQGKLLQLKNETRNTFGSLFRYVKGGRGTNTRISDLFKGLENELYYVPNLAVMDTITPEVVDRVKALYTDEFTKVSDALKSRGGKTDVSENIKRIMTNGYTTVIIDGLPYKVSIEDAIRSTADKLAAGKVEGIEDYLKIANSDSLDNLTLEAQKNIYGVLHSAYMTRAYREGIDEYHNIIRGLFGDAEDQAVVRFLDEYNPQTVSTVGIGVKDAYGTDVMIPKAMIEVSDNAESYLVKSRAFDRVSLLARDGKTITPEMISKEVKQAFQDVKVAVHNPNYPPNLQSRIENFMGTYSRLSNLRQADGSTLLQLVDGFDSKTIGGKANELLDQFRLKVENEKNIRTTIAEQMADSGILDNVSINGTPINTFINDVPESVQVNSSYLSYEMKTGDTPLKKGNDIFDEIVKKVYKDNDIVKNQKIIDDINKDFTTC